MVTTYSIVGSPVNQEITPYQKMGVLSTIAAVREEDLRVLRLTLNMLDAQDATRRSYPSKESNRTTKPLWRVDRIYPEEQTIHKCRILRRFCLP